jgi:membrane protein DedA with SNARE-associated domain
MFDWITGFVEESGYLGIALLMLAENVFPPIPSELIMPLAGFTAARGDLNIVLVVISGTLGSVLGTALWYWLGRRLGMGRLKNLAERHGRWLTLSPSDLDRAQRLFRRHSGQAVFFGRLIPAVRTLISVPAGIVGMPVGWFLFYTLLGSVLWNILLAGAGYMLQTQYQAVSEWLNPATDVVLGLILTVYFYRVVTFQAKPRS